MNRFWDNIKLLFSSLALIGYLFISIGFFWYTIIPNTHSSHGNEVHCSYIIGENVLCSMNLIDFINKWKQIYLVFGSFSNILSFLSIGIIFIFSIYILSNQVIRCISYIEKKIRPPLLYVILFSKGILNSKAY